MFHGDNQSPPSVKELIIVVLLKKKGTKPHIALDDGHGMSTSGKRTPVLPTGLKSETGNFMHENEFNRAVVKYLKVELERCGFLITLTAPTDADTGITARAKTATNAKADLLLSVHANAATGQWGSASGVETLSKPENKDLALVFQKWLMKGTGQKNRGWKDGAWLGLNAFKGPVVLVEAGFMDNLTEAKLLLSDDFRKECAKELAQAACEVFGVKYVGANTSSKATTSVEYPYDTTKGIGTLTVLVNNLNMRKDANFNSAVVGTATKGMVYYVFETKNGLHRIATSAWVSAGVAYTKFTPHPVRKTYVVVKGDTLWAIASRNGTSVSKLMTLNSGLNAENLKVGQKIYLA